MSRSAIEDTREVQALKRLAKKLKKEHDLSHSQALDRVAVSKGYLNWSLLYKDLNK